jgi:ribosomal protein S18 acetylase RimI-like enzyme
MDSVIHAPDVVRIEPLTEDRADQLADQLIAMARDLDWDDWGRENLMSPRAEKWERSLLALRDGRPVAWAVVSRTVQGAHLHHIVVARDERSTGVGALLISEVVRRTSPGILTLKVPPNNEAAARFYVRLGFDEQTRCPNGYRVFSRNTSDDEAPAI